jgi:dolichol-phosphate mannosyltransferase
LHLSGVQQIVLKRLDMTSPEISVIVPTYNEAKNVPLLINRLECVLAGRAWEVIFVDDDSTDGTANVVRDISRSKHYVRCVLRLGRRGLSRAVIEGVLTTSSPLVAVMDGDLQHDEAVLPMLLDALGAADVAIGSRYIAGGEGAQGLATAGRQKLSAFAAQLARHVLHVSVSDPMSGFFALRRTAFDQVVRSLSGEGYKILLDVLASAPDPFRVIEVPYVFRPRMTGKSKLDSAVLWEYVVLLIDKRVGRIAPARFVMFAFVGSTGVIVHLAALWTFFLALGLGFAASQALATLCAMTSNYAINNMVTYQDRRHHGLGWFFGLLSFYAICGIGVLGNVGIANALFERDGGWLASAAAGALVGTVWNYVATAFFTWRRSQ